MEPIAVLHVSSLSELRLLGAPAPTCLAVGVFDGVHLGHARLLERVDALARAAATPMGGGGRLRRAVLTFQNHPLTLLRPQDAPRALSSLERRAEWLDERGIDLVVALEFDRALASTEPEAFLREIVVGALGARVIVCGPDFRFGLGGAGNADLIRRLEPELGLRAAPVDPLWMDGEPVSSSRIRRLIREGDVADAARLLGRPHELEGRVESGRGRGRAIGFPTANLALAERMVVPRTGVYVVEATPLDPEERPFGGMMNIGYSPTFGDIEDLRIEAHLFDYADDLVGRRLRVRVAERLRDEQHFPSVEALVGQLERDETRARAALADKSARDQ